MIELAAALLAIPIFVAIVEWRLGLLLALGTALLQDPLRKITPDQPVLFVAFVGVVFAAACVGAVVRGVSLRPNTIFRHYPPLQLAIFFLLVLIVFQSINSLSRFGNPMITLTGLLTYLLPIPSVVFAYQLFLRGGEARVIQFIKAYVLCTLLALTTIYLAFAGYDSELFRSVGPALVTYHDRVGVVLSHSGVFRSPEIAAWHAMTCACFILLLMTLREIRFVPLLLTAVALILLIGVGLLTARRKILIELAVFAGTYFILWAIFCRNMQRLSALLATAALAACIWTMVQVSDFENVSDRPSTYSVYVDRAKSVFQDVPSRFVELGIAPIMWAYDRFGFFGAGLGVGTQGTQYFGGGGVIAGAAEGGLGKIMLELGIPGIFVMGSIAICIFRYLWQIMRFSSHVSPVTGRLSFGFFSFLVANVAGFSIGTQVYGDLFVLLILSWALGFLFSIPALIGKQLDARELRKLTGRGAVLRPGTI